MKIAIALLLSSLSALSQQLTTEGAMFRTNVMVTNAYVRFPFIGYPKANDVGFVPVIITFGNASNTALAYTINYQNNTNGDSSINTVFREGAQTITLKFRRTNNTATDLSGGSRTVELPVLTTFTGGDVMNLPSVVYQATAGDIVQIFGVVSATPSAGSVQTDSAELVAIRLF